MKRIFAHNIIYEGQVYIRHVAQYDHTTGRVTLFPFTEETECTEFISGTVEVKVVDGRLHATKIASSALLF